MVWVEMVGMKWGEKCRDECLSQYHCKLEGEHQRQDCEGRGKLLKFVSM